MRQFLDQANLQLLEAYPSEQIIASDGAEAYVNFRRLQTIIYDLPIVVRPPTADSPNAASINANTPYRGHVQKKQNFFTYFCLCALFLNFFSILVLGRPRCMD